MCWRICFSVNAHIQKALFYTSSEAVSVSKSSVKRRNYYYISKSNNCSAHIYFSISNYIFVKCLEAWIYCYILLFWKYQWSNTCHNPITSRWISIQDMNTFNVVYIYNFSAAISYPTFFKQTQLKVTLGRRMYSGQ